MITLESVKTFLAAKLPTLSADMIGWIAVLFIHGATIPPVIGLLLGVSDRLPSIDVVLFLWTGLVLMFARSLIIKDMLNVITIGIGFMVQATLLGFLVFK
jgi:hypothetical protein